MNPLQIVAADMLLGYANQFAKEETFAGRSVRPDEMANEGIRRTADHLEKAAKILRAGLITITEAKAA